MDLLTVEIRKGVLSGEGNRRVVRILSEEGECIRQVQFIPQDQTHLEAVVNSEINLAARIRDNVYKGGSRNTSSVFEIVGTPEPIEMPKETGTW